MNDRPVNEVGERAADLMRSFFGAASPATVFGDPYRMGEETVITASAWERAGGFGFGAGGDEDGNGGGGGGGGGASQGRPVAVIRLTPTGTDVTALPDVTKIAVTVILAAVGVWRALRV